MRAVVGRLRRLEAQFMPVADHESQHWVDILRERRRRRAEAEGIPSDNRRPEPVYDKHGGRPMTWADVLRARRSQRAAEAESRHAENEEQTP
jgi:hypothetical protein